MPMQSKPVLLFNDECGVCRRIAGWVQRSDRGVRDESSLLVQPIGDDPDALQALHPGLDIWEAYATIHLLMPDGSVKKGGEAVAEVLRSLPNTRWLAGMFTIHIFGFRPFQLLLNLAYALLADIRPIFGCESCGTPSLWLRPLHEIAKAVRSAFGKKRSLVHTAHFTARVEAARATRARA